MMTSLGHEVFLYAGIENEATVTEFVTVVNTDDLAKWFNGNDWNNGFDHWLPSEECWEVMNERAAAEINARRQHGDLLCLIAGACQFKLTTLVPGMRSVEWGIGYEGIINPGFRVFESNAWMHYVYGQLKIVNGAFFDTVIPNSFDDEDYIYSDDKKSDYLLYLGRLTPRKGLEVVSQLAARGHKIITAGQGDIRIPGAEHMGVVRGKEKAELLAGAKALLCPTFYIEPFGGVAVEAMLSGTPIITTDFGAFTETVRDGIDGFRCHFMGEFERATERVLGLDSKEIRGHAEQYLTKHIRYKYDDYFKRIALLDGQGWYTYN